MLRFTNPMTWSASVAVLLVKLVSTTLENGITETVLVTVPPLAVTVAMTVNVKVDPTEEVAMTRPDPSNAATVRVAGQAVPADATQVTEFFVKPTTAGSDTVVVTAGSGPALVITMV